MMRIACIIWCAFYLAKPLLAQDGPNYHIREYTTDNGMPSNGIKGLQWDEQTGFLWIATEAGVARFNGLDFTVFTKENTPGLQQERLAFIVKNNEDEIYTADISGNILAVKNNSLVHLPLPELDNMIVFKKKIYLSSDSSEMRKKLLPLLQKKSYTLWIDLVQLTDTSLVIADDKKNFYLLTKNKAELDTLHIPQNLGNPFTIGGQLFFWSQDRQVYISTDNFQHLQKVNINFAGKELTTSASNTILYWTTGMATPILFSDNNAWLLHYKNGLIDAELICTAVPSYSYISVAQYSAEKKTLFIGTDSKGIIVITENKVTAVKKKTTDIKERNAYYSQIALPNGNILTNEGHIIGFAPNTLTPPLISGKFNYTVYQEADSVLWYTQLDPSIGYSCLHKYVSNTKKTLSYPKIVVRENFALTHLNGYTYVATDRGLGILEDDSLKQIYQTSRDIFFHESPYAMEVFAPGQLGIASCNGLFLFDTKTNKADTLLQLPGYCIRTLWKYKDYVFIGTYGKGFYIWKNGKLKAMPVDKNKFLLYTHCFVPDQYGFCWISTNRGLFKAQLSDLLTAFDTDTPQLYYHYFGKNDGMDITEMNGGCTPCALRMKQDVLSFPTMDGLLWVNPEKAKPLLPEGNIYVDAFTAEGKKVNADSLTIKNLPATTKTIAIQLGFSSWCNKENIYLDYKLNANNTWTSVDVNSGAVINLSGLTPGSYTLIIRKLNGFGINNYSYKEISFTIRTPWHQQWWFYTLCILALFTLIALYLSFRTRQYKLRQKKLETQVTEKTKELQQQNQLLEKSDGIKTRLISIISHDIITPLKFLTVAGKNLVEKRKAMSDELQQETIQEITNTSQELQFLSTNILNWIKYQNENRRQAKETFYLHDLVKQVLGILQSLAKQKNLLIENSVSESLKVHQYYEPLKILIYNLLTNSIHFTESGTITVAAIEVDNTIIVSVKDMGIGMTKEQVQRILADEVVITSANIDNRKGHGLGYLIIKDLIKTMSAQLSIESKKNEGTTVSIIIPSSAF